MKAKFIIPIMATLLSGACSSSYFVISGQTDDIYYVPGKKADNTQSQVQSQAQSQPQVQTVNAGPSDNNSGELTDYEKYRQSLDENENASPDTNAVSGQQQSDSVNNPVASQNPPDTLREPNEQSQDYNSYDGANNYYPYYGYNYDPFFMDAFCWYNPIGWRFGFGWGYYDPWFTDFYYPWGYYGYYPYYYHPYWGGFHHGYYGYHGGYPFSRSYYGYRAGRSLTNYSMEGRRGYGAQVAVRRTALNSGRSSVYSSRRSVRQNYSAARATGARSVYIRSSNGVPVSSQRTYTPSYSKPRSYSRPSYNESSRVMYRGSQATRSYNNSSYRSSGSGFSSSRASFGGGSRSSGGGFHGGGGGFHGGGGRR